MVTILRPHSCPHLSRFFVPSGLMLGPHPPAFPSQIHGNICLAAIVVTGTLDWKLHGFDLLSEHQASPMDFPLMGAAWLVGAQFKPGEVAKSEWQIVRDSPPWAVDAWGLGCLIQELYSGHTLMRTEDLRNTQNIPKDVLPHYQVRVGA